MLGGIPLVPSLRRAAVVLGLLGLGPGCQSSSPLVSAGVDLTVPSSWRPVARTMWPVPGVPLAAWSGPDGSSLVIYRSLPVPDGSAESLARGLATRLTNLPGLTMLDQGISTVSAHPAARVEVIAPGTGDTLAPSGAGTPIAPPGRTLVDTRRLMVVIPRKGDTLTLLWHFPAFQEHARQVVDGTLVTLRLQDHSPMSSTY